MQRVYWLILACCEISLFSSRFRVVPDWPDTDWPDRRLFLCLSCGYVLCENVLQTGLQVLMELHF